MILVEQIKVEVETDILNEDGKFLLAVPKFKQDYAKKTKEMWRMFELGDKFTNKDLIGKINEINLILNKFKYDITEFSRENGDLDDWV